MGNFRPYFILMLTSSSSYSNNIKVMMAIDITVTKYDKRNIIIIKGKRNFSIVRQGQLRGQDFPNSKYT